MRKNGVEVLTAFGDDGRETDDFRARADYDEELQFSVVGELHSAVICSYLLGHNMFEIICSIEYFEYLCK